MQSYDILIEKIAKSAGLDKAEVERKVDAKKAKLSGLISKEGAAQIISAELGVSFENLESKISELIPGMRQVNIIGKIIEMFPVREYEKNNRKGKIGSFILADETGNIRIVLWDTNHIELIEKGEIKKEDFVDIKNASMRESEVHLSGFSEIKKSDVVLAEVKTEKSFSEIELDGVREGQNISIRGVVVQLFNPRFFSVCPECRKKAVEDGEGFSCAEHGKVNAEERSLINFVLDDGTETIRVVLFSDQINKLIPEQELKDSDKLFEFREGFLGEEVVISGVARKNQMFNNIELIGQDVNRIDADKLIEVLEKKD